MKEFTNNIEDDSAVMPDFDSYRSWLVHDWSKILTLLVVTLVPVFFILDNFTMPKELLPRFAVYRIVPTLIAVLQYFIIKRTNPGKFSVLHGYIVSFFVGGAISLMTVDLGGFDSRYYAGLNLVIIGVTILLPWGALHSAINCLITEIFYLSVNFFISQPFHIDNLVSNLFFINATIIIAVSINHVRFMLIRQEFTVRSLLKSARDSLWSEMEIATKIQSSILPDIKKIGPYEITARMLPAREIGGDYYDIIKSATGENWLAIGDVSGHGVESGLIMMMTQTAIFSLLNTRSGYKPSVLIDNVNSVIRKNIKRLGLQHYMTIQVMRLENEKIITAGKHQFILIYRSGEKRVEKIATEGTWIGLTEGIEKYLINMSIPVDKGDILLLYTDGATEALDKRGEMFGDERLVSYFAEYAELPPEEIINRLVNAVFLHQKEQEDDVTFLVIKRVE